MKYYVRGIPFEATDLFVAKYFNVQKSCVNMPMFDNRKNKGFAIIDVGNDSKMAETVRKKNGAYMEVLFPRV